MTHDQLICLYKVLLKESDQMHLNAEARNNGPTGNLAFFTEMASSRVLLGLAAAFLEVAHITPLADPYDGK